MKRSLLVLALALPGVVYGATALTKASECPLSCPIPCPCDSK